MPVLILALILANVIISMAGFRDPGFFDRYMYRQSAVARQKQYYRLITSGFLHANWMHLLFNMLTFYFFYSTPAGVMGEINFLLLYFGSLVLSGLWTMFVHRNEPYYSAVGASGAVTAVVFSAIMLQPDLRLVILPIPIPLPGYVFALAYLLYTTYGMRRNADNIGHAAHMGGAAAGVLITVAMYPSVLSVRPWVTVGLLVLVLALLAGEYFRAKANS